MDSPSVEQNRAPYLLLSGSHAATQAANPINACLSTDNKIMVLDYENRFKVFPLRRKIRKVAPLVTTSLNNTGVARTFTCYQVVSLLLGLSILPDYVVVLDLLSTFYDENVPIVERKRLLLESIMHLRRLSGSLQVLVTTKPLPSSKEPTLNELEIILVSSAESFYQMQSLEPKAVDIAQLWPMIVIA